MGSPGGGFAQASDDELRVRLQGVVSEISALALSAGRGDLVAPLQSAAVRAGRTQVPIVVVGEYSSGKSALLNALLEQTNELLPTDSAVATRVLTSVRAGAVESIVVALAADGDKPAEQREITRDELASFLNQADVAGGQGAAEAARLQSVSIGLPSRKLEDGVVLIDTPGIGGVHRSHRALTLAVLPEADVVVYVTSAIRPPLPLEVAFIAETARTVGAVGSPERLLFAVTKADLTPDRAQAVATVEALLPNVPGLSSHGVYPVSSHHRVRHLIGGAGEDWPSGFEDFEAALGQAVARAKLRTRVGLVLPELLGAVVSLLGPLEETLEVLAAKDEERRARLLETADRQLAEAERLAEGAAEWPRELRSAMAAVQVELRGSVEQELAAAWRRLRAAYRQEPAFLDDPGSVVDELAAQMSALVADLGADATARTREVCRDLAARSGLPPIAAVLDPLRRPPMPGPADAAAPPPTPVETRFVEACVVAEKFAKVGADAGGVVGRLVWNKGNPALAVGSTVANMIEGVVLASSDAGPAKDQDFEPSGGARPPARLAGTFDALVGVGNPGEVIGRLVVGLAAGGFGLAAALVGLSRRARAERIAALDELLAPWEAQQRDFLLDALGDLVEAFSAAALADITARVERRRSECEAKLAAAKAAAAETEQGAAKTVEALEQRRSALIRIRELLMAVDAEVALRLGSGA